MGSQAKAKDSRRKAPKAGLKPGIKVSLVIFTLAILSFLSLSTGAMGFFEPSTWLYHRFPRLLSSLLIGAILAGSGTVTQTLFRNPLADPSILGLSTGGALGALISFLIFSGQPPVALLGLGAGVGSASAASVIFLLGKNRGSWSPTPLILSGLVISSLLTAITSILLLRSPQQIITQFLFWTVGDLGAQNWPTVLAALFVGLPGLLVILVRRKRLDILPLDDKTMFSLGTNPGMERAFFLFLTAALIGTAVSLAGPLGFLGLMVPHFLRMLGIKRPSRLFPYSMLLGGVFLTAIDTLNRALGTPGPVGVWTSLLGGGFFLFLLIRSRRSHQDWTPPRMRHEKFGTAPPTILLRAHNIELRTGEKVILSPLNLTVHPGEWLGIGGPNGSGKTSLLEILAGLRSPSSGEVIWKGKDARKWSAPEAAGFRSYGAVNEDPRLPFSSLERLLLGTDLQAGVILKAQGELDLRSTWAMEFLRATGIEALQDYGTLSQGQKDLLRWGAQILQDCPVLFIDEPGVHLDPDHREFLLEGLRLERQRGKTIVMAAQHPTDFPRDCGRLLLLKEGKVAFEGTAQEFLKGEHHRKIWNSNKRSPVPGW
jgi:iron complex transport system permease protein